MTSEERMAMYAGSIRPGRQEELEVMRHKEYKCDCCDRYTTLYRRLLSFGITAPLIWLVRNYETEPAHLSRWAPNLRGGDYGKLELWGLAVQSENTDSTKKDSGVWSATESGVAFILGEGQMPKYAYAWSPGQILEGYSKELVTIQDTLGKRFNYQELMHGSQDAST